VVVVINLVLVGGWVFPVHANRHLRHNMVNIIHVQQLTEVFSNLFKILWESAS